MANPNPEIWGAPETWQNNFVFGGSTTAGAENLKASKAKVAKWDVEGWTIGTSQLRAGVLNNKITANQPIDKTICPCGQDIRASHLNQIGVFVNRNLTEYPDDDDVQYITLINGLNNNGKPLNWCFFECRRPGSGASAYFQNGYQLDMANTRYPYTVWEPDSDFDSSISSKQNGNYYVAPLVSYQSRSILLRIEVDVIDTTYADGSPHGTNTVTLEEWKNSYSDKKICRIGLRMYKVYSLALSSITYNAPTIGNYDYSGAMLLDTIAVGTTEYALQPSFQHFGFMGMGQTGYITILPYIQNLSNQRQSNEYIYGFMPCMNLFEGAELKSVRKSSSDSRLGKVWQEIPYSDDTYEKIMSMAALFGCPFTPTSKLSFNNAFTDADLCLPIIDDNGITHGEYTRGSGNTDNPFIELDNVRDKDYKPDADVDTNTYSITTGFNTVGNVASTTKQYVVNANALRGLSGEMWNILNSLVTTPDDMTNLDNLTLDAFLTNNPIDAIVSVKKFPLSSVPHAENLENIYLGKYQTGAAGYALALQQARYNFEGISIFPKFGNCFLDYSPYTKMQLYVPFCGTIDIDAADFMGRTLSVEMVIDFITGAVTAYVLANQLVVTSLTGNCGIDIAITGTEQSTVSAALENAILQDKSARGNYALKGSVGGMLTNPIGNITNPTSAIENRFSTKLQTMQANYNLQHVEMPLRQIGNASPLNSWALEFVCRLIIYYPDGECISFNATNEPSLIDEKVESFGAVNGFATVETNTLSSFTGFTQVSDADLSGVSATDTEKEMILNLLQSGVYL